MPVSVSLIVEPTDLYLLSQSEQKQIKSEQYSIIINYCIISKSEDHQQL